MRPLRIASGAVLAMCMAVAHAQPPRVAAHTDPERSHLSFELRTRFGQRIQGVFPRHEGEVELLPDGRQRVRLRLQAASVEIPERPRYTGWMRGESFFDVRRYPLVEFESQPFSPQLLIDGGELIGNLTIRDVRREETLTMLPSECDRPGYDCDLVVQGNVRRGLYGMDNWDLALSDRVRLELRVRLKEPPAP